MIFGKSKDCILVPEEPSACSGGDFRRQQATTRVLTDEKGHSIKIRVASPPPQRLALARAAPPDPPESGRAAPESRRACPNERPAEQPVGRCPQSDSSGDGGGERRGVAAEGRAGGGRRHSLATYVIASVSTSPFLA